MSEKSARFARLYGLVKDVAKPGNVVLAFMLIVIGVVAVTGGWAKATQGVEKEDTLPTIELGKDFTAGPFTLVFSSVRQVDTCPDVAYGAQYGCIEAHLTITNTTSRLIEDSKLGTHLIDSGMLTVTVNDDPLPTLARYPQIIRDIDGLNQGAYQPGLPTTVVALWQPSEPITSTDVTLAVTGATETRSALDGHHYYRLTDPIAHIPVEPASSATQAAP